jgi:DNA-binding response OmpR family regulator
MEATDPSSIRLLIVGDDESTSTRLLEYFQSKAYTTTTVGDADTALRYLSQSPGYDVVLLDLSLPGKNGFELLEEVQAHSITASFILLTSRDRLEDKLRGFDLGADDYVVKPCAVEELQARVEAVFNRQSSTPSPSKEEQSFTFGELAINLASHTCSRDGRRIPLTALEFEILTYLVEHRGRAIPRDQLRDAVWSDRENICLRTIDRHVAKIRRKIERDCKQPAYLQTVYGKGYQFAAAESA